MVLKGDIMTQEHAKNQFFSSFEGKYMIMDNLDEKGDPIIRERNEIYNSEYVYITVVLRGTLNMIVGSTKIEVKANEYIAIMPCMSVTIMESRCIYFCFLTRSHLMTDIYQRAGVSKQLDVDSLSAPYRNAATVAKEPDAETQNVESIDLLKETEKTDIEQALAEMTNQQLHMTAISAPPAPQMTQTEKEKQHVIFHAFKFRHARFTVDKISLMLDCYKRIKKEHLTKDYPMKEIVLRSYQTAYVAKFFSFATPDNIINYVTNDRQFQMFNDFLTLLNHKHKEQRAVQYYAKEMYITPKYLSTVVQKFTGMTASAVIDQYVVFAIKQSLYVNDRSIKNVSIEYNFPSQSFFGRYFKRITGYSPNEYIKKNNVKSINFQN